MMLFPTRKAYTEEGAIAVMEGNSEFSLGYLEFELSTELPSQKHRSRLSLLVEESRVDFNICVISWSLKSVVISLREHLQTRV